MQSKHFVELGAPQKGHYGLGWYAAAPFSESDPNNDRFYYLHNDGNVYDFCYDTGVSPSNGWFKTKEACVTAATAYYKKHGLVYPYNRTHNTNHSTPMDFV